MFKKFVIVLGFAFCTLLFSPGNFFAEKSKAAEIETVEEGQVLTEEMIESPDKWESLSDDQKQEIQDFVEAEAPSSEELENITTEQEFYEVWDTFTKAEQTAYVASNIAVEEVELPTTISPTVQKYQKMVTTAAAANKYNSFASPLIGKNLAGGELYRYTASVSWYYNGVKIVSKTVKEIPSVKVFGWSYEGRAEFSEATTYNGFDYERYVVGKFKFSLPGWDFQTKYPTFDYRIRANGAYNLSKWIG